MAKPQNVVFLPHTPLTLSAHSYNAEYHDIVPTSLADVVKLARKCVLAQDATDPTRTFRRPNYRNRIPKV